MHRLPLERRRGTGRRALNHGPAPFKDVGVARRESDGVFFATLRIGTPLRDFSVIVDTGSTTVAVPCEGCACGSGHASFRPNASASARGTGTQYTQCYSEGSCNYGEYYVDAMCLGERCTANETIRHPFGCCDEYSEAFKAQFADGVVGLSGSADGLIADLREHHEIEENVVSLCLGARTGSLTVGGYDAHPLVEEMQWTPLDRSTGMYSVNLSRLLVDGAAAGEFPPNRETVIDSGSTLTYVDAAMHAALRRSFDAYCADPSKCKGTRNPPRTPKADARDAVVCYAPPAGEPDAGAWLDANFPTLELEFGNGVRACILPSSYFFLSAKEESAYCVGILADSRTTLGAITLSGFTVAFDFAANRVGWARSDCDGDGATKCCGAGCSAAPTLPPTEGGAPAPIPAHFVIFFGAAGLVVVCIVVWHVACCMLNCRGCRGVDVRGKYEEVDEREKLRVDTP